MKSKPGIIKEYFGLRTGDTAKDFMLEYKALSDDERTELARGAAAAMGLSQSDVNFPLVDAD